MRAHWNSIRWLTPARLAWSVLACCCLAYWFALAMVARPGTHGHVIGSDGIFYYEYLPSAVIDGDLDFANQRQLVRDEGIAYSVGPPLSLDGAVHETGVSNTSNESPLDPKNAIAPTPSGPTAPLG